MRTVEIPRAAWAQALNEFTAIHEGWLVSLDVLGPTIGAQPEVNNLPLLGVSVDRAAAEIMMVPSWSVWSNETPRSGRLLIAA